MVLTLPINIPVARHFPGDPCSQVLLGTLPVGQTPYSQATSAVQTGRVLFPVHVAKRHWGDDSLILSRIIFWGVVELL